MIGILVKEHNLPSFIRQVQHTVDHVAASSEQLSKAMEQAGQISAQVAAAVQQQSATIEEMAAGAKKNGYSFTYNHYVIMRLNPADKW
jgi:methyl-accepting chemotaxis protein